MLDDRVSPREVLEATRQLAMLTRLKFPLSDGLQAMGQESRWLAGVGSELAAGDSLTQAAARHPRVFSPFYRGMVEAAEAAEQPERILTSLSHFLERSETLHREVRTSLLYPLVVLNAALVELLFFVGMIFPTTLTAMGGRPGPAGASPAGIVIILVVLGVLDVFALQREVIPRIAARWPLLGPLQRLAQQGLWAEALGTLLAAGVSLPAALRQAQSVVTDPQLANTLAPLADRVDHGTSLSDALHDLRGLDPCLAWSAGAGERREDLAPLMLDAATYLDRQVDHRQAHVLQMLEPWAQVAVGVVVCSVLVSFWAPFYNGLVSMH